MTDTAMTDASIAGAIDLDADGFARATEDILLSLIHI